MKHQTSTEYLVIVSVVIIIGLIVVSVLGGIPSIGGKTNERASATVTLRTNEIATESWRVSNGSTTLFLRNNKPYTITVDGLDINGTACNHGFPIRLGSGSGREITCTNINSTDYEQAYVYTYNASWSNAEDGGSYVETFPDLKGTVSGITPAVTAAAVDGTYAWNVTWGGSGREYAQGADYDGTYIYMIGETDSFGAGGNDSVLVKFNESGQQEWNATWGGTGRERPYGVIYYDSYVYVTGYTDSFGGTNDVYLLKYNLSGDREWNVTWDSGNSDIPRDIEVISNELFVVGYQEISGLDYDTLIINYDLDGNYQWNVTDGLSGLYDISQSSSASGGYLYTGGRAYNAGFSDTHIFLKQYNTSGEVEWTVIYNTSTSENAYDIEVSGTEIYTVGSTAAPGQILLINHNTTGQHEWNVTYGDGAEYNQGTGVSIIDSSIYFTGHTERSGTGTWDVIVMKSYPNGTQEWNVSFVDDGGDTGNVVLGDADKIFVAATGDSAGAGGDDFLLLRYD